LLCEISGVKQTNEDFRQENVIAKQGMADLEATARSAIAELEGTFEATRADCIRLVRLKQNRIHQVGEAAPASRVDIGGVECPRATIAGGTVPHGSADRRGEARGRG
jgi:hypothetical protein